MKFSKIIRWLVNWNIKCDLPAIIDIIINTVDTIFFRVPLKLKEKLKIYTFLKQFYSYLKKYFVRRKMIASIPISHQ